MNKEEMLRVIKAHEAIMELNDFFCKATESKGLEGTLFEAIFGIADVLYRNCSFYEKRSDIAFAHFA